jgi:hypothetical protein
MDFALVASSRFDPTSGESCEVGDPIARFGPSPRFYAWLSQPAVDREYHSAIASSKDTPVAARKFWLRHEHRGHGNYIANSGVAVVDHVGRNSFG